MSRNLNAHMAQAMLDELRTAAACLREAQTGKPRFADRTPPVQRSRMALDRVWKTAQQLDPRRPVRHQIQLAIKANKQIAVRGLRPGTDQFRQQALDAERRVSGAIYALAVDIIGSWQHNEHNAASNREDTANPTDRVHDVAPEELGQMMSATHT